MLGIATCMPNEPISYDKLDQLCHPVSAKFQFFSDPYLHCAISEQPHGRKIQFNSRHLILAGLLDSNRLMDQIRKGPLVIRIHDRDYRLPDDLRQIYAGE